MKKLLLLPIIALALLACSKEDVKQSATFNHAYRLTDSNGVLSDKETFNTATYIYEAESINPDTSIYSLIYQESIIDKNGATIEVKYKAQTNTNITTFDNLSKGRYIAVSIFQLDAVYYGYKAFEVDGKSDSKTYNLTFDLDNHPAFRLFELLLKE
ncbi:MAG: hypothetical protein ACRCZB_04645 [Bacteroidales bacterium]